MFDNCLDILHPTRLVLSPISLSESLFPRLSIQINLTGKPKKARKVLRAPGKNPEDIAAADLTNRRSRITSSLNERSDRAAPRRGCDAAT